MPGSRRRVVNSLRIQLAGQLRVSEQVHSPELFQPPRRHRLRIHRADVGIGHHGELLQPLHGSHALGQRLARSRRRADRARSSRRKDPDAGRSEIRRWRGPPPARPDAVSTSRAMRSDPGDMIAPGPFADIVQQQREAHQVRVGIRANRSGKAPIAMIDSSDAMATSVCSSTV